MCPQSTTDQVTKKEFHKTLIRIALALKYPVFEDGLCEGACMAAMQTFLQIKQLATGSNPICNVSIS